MHQVLLAVSIYSNAHFLLNSHRVSGTFLLFFLIAALERKNKKPGKTERRWNTLAEHEHPAYLPVSWEKR